MEMAFWGAKNISHFCNSDHPGQSGETATRGIHSQHSRDRLGACRSMQARSDDLLLRVVRELVGFYFPVIQLRGTKTQFSSRLVGCGTSINYTTKTSNTFHRGTSICMASSTRTHDLDNSPSHVQ